MNYINSAINVLADKTDVDNALQGIEANTDPGTGFEIAVNAPMMAVMPMKRVLATDILNAEWNRISSGTVPISQAKGTNLPPIELVTLTRLWYNLLVASGLSASYSSNRWWLGDFQRAFEYTQHIPFRTQQVPVSSEEVRRSIVGVWIADERGVPNVIEPRFSYMSTEDDISP